MDPLYFRISAAPDLAAFDPYWLELPPEPFVVDRGVVRTADVSRCRTKCLVLRPDPDEGCWELRNRAPERTVIVDNGEQRYELRCGMSMVLRAGLWQGSLTEAFSFLVTSRRPPGIVRSVTPRAGGAEPEQITRRRGRAARAERFLDVHRDDRLIMAYMWREHIAHTADVAEDLKPAQVARAFLVTSEVVTDRRSAFAKVVYEEIGHQHAIRDLVIDAGLLTRADVAEADREVARRRVRAS